MSKSCANFLSKGDSTPVEIPRAASVARFNEFQGSHRRFDLIPSRGGCTKSAIVRGTQLKEPFFGDFGIVVPRG
jgi:hypothetical protein